MRLSRFALLATVAIAAIIIYSTLAPIGSRPHSIFDPEFERFGAYLSLGVAAMLAFPRHVIAVSGATAGLAVGLELLQLVDPGRDGRIIDAGTKVLGALVGAATTWIAGAVRKRRP
jgi:VanZ family protein